MPLVQVLLPVVVVVVAQVQAVMEAMEEHLLLALPAQVEVL